MSTLEDRLKEVMAAKGWTRSDLMRVTKQSSSVVSQWLGNGTKTIHSIGKMEVAMRLEEETGFAALWIAKGTGPKMGVARPASRESPAPPAAQEPAVSYSPDPKRPPLDVAIDTVLDAFWGAPDTERAIAAAILHQIADDKGDRRTLRRALLSHIYGSDPPPSWYEAAHAWKMLNNNPEVLTRINDEWRDITGIHQIMLARWHNRRELAQYVTPSDLQEVKQT